MFIRTKTIKGHDYYYVCKSERKGDTVRQITVAYGGKTRSEAEAKMKAL